MKPKDSSVPQYRLTITGDADMIDQVRQAIELQGRLHLGQFETIQRELVAGADPSPYVRYGGEESPTVIADKDAFLNLLEAIGICFQTAKGIWCQRRSTWRDNHTYARFHHNTREQRAYSLWKGIHRELTIARGLTPPGDDYGVVPGRVAVERIEEQK